MFFARTAGHRNPKTGLSGGFHVKTKNHQRLQCLQAEHETNIKHDSVSPTQNAVPSCHKWCGGGLRPIISKNQRSCPFFVVYVRRPQTKPKSTWNEMTSPENEQQANIDPFQGSYFQQFPTSICAHTSALRFVCIYIYIPGHPKAAFFWSGLKSSERPKIEQLLILPSVSRIWKDQKYDAK